MQIGIQSHPLRVDKEWRNPLSSYKGEIERDFVRATNLKNDKNSFTKCLFSSYTQYAQLIVLLLVDEEQDKRKKSQGRKHHRTNRIWNEKYTNKIPKRI
jgi:hypothetical protein